MAAERCREEWAEGAMHLTRSVCFRYKGAGLQMIRQLGLLRVRRMRFPRQNLIKPLKARHAWVWCLLHNNAPNQQRGGRDHASIR